MQQITQSELDERIVSTTYPTGRTVRDRYLSKVKIGKKNECWEWEGSLDKDGRGTFKFNGHSYPQGRFAWLMYRGPIPSGLFVCHHCDNPSCCNPQHLFLGTHQDNMRDRTLKGRDHLCAGKGHPPGADHPCATLTTEEVVAIRLFYEYTKTTYVELASIFNTSKKNIGHIIRKETWKNI